MSGEVKYATGNDSQSSGSSWQDIASPKPAAWPSEHFNRALACMKSIMHARSARMYFPSRTFKKPIAFFGRSNFVISLVVQSLLTKGAKNNETAEQKNSKCTLIHTGCTMRTGALFMSHPYERFPRLTSAAKDGKRYFKRLLSSPNEVSMAKFRSRILKSSRQPTALSLKQHDE